VSFLRFSILLALALLVSGFARKPKINVRFHVEATGNAGGSFTIKAKFVNPPRDGFVESIPFASERNIVGIYPVLNPDSSLGCVFKLDQSGSLGLRTVSTERRGASMVSYISTKGGTHQLVDLPIDKPIVDGMIYIPRGITNGEMEVLKKQFPLMQAPQKKAE